MRHPDRITAIISQNGNAYEEGLSDGWNPIRAYWQDASQANREALRAFLKPETTVWQYTHGVPDATTVSPDGYSLDNFYLARPGADEVQLDLFGDYKSNVALYPTFQNYFRTHKPPFLAVWGKNDPFFLPPAPRRSSATSRTRWCASSTPAISRWRPMPRRSRRPSANFFPADFVEKADRSGIVGVHNRRPIRELDTKRRRLQMSKSVAIVTGASQGIGQATAIRLARDFSGWSWSRATVRISKRRRRR